MPPIAPRWYFAELLEIGKSKAPQTERLNQVELLIERFLSELESVGDIEDKLFSTMLGHDVSVADRCAKRRSRSR